uniref:carboxypeptidase regulatory-like domain-containing protein n=1 Tax=Haliangium sp. TaxID=2663208 RepID=UPI003D0A9EE4
VALWTGPAPGPAELGDAGVARDDAGRALLAPPARPGLPTAQSGTGTFSLVGEVVDTGGGAVAEAVVTSIIELGPGLEVAGPSLDTSPAVVAIADADGTFTLEGLEVGRHRLRVEGDGFFTAEVRFFEVPADSVRLVVARRVAVRGQVVDPAGGSVADIPVSVLRDGVTVARARTDEAGAFAVDGLSEGVFQVWAGAGTRAAPVRSVARLGAGPFEPVELILGPAVVVTGRVVDRKSGAGVRAAVMLSSIAGAGTGAGEPTRHGHSDERGDFRIEAVPAGPWRVEADAAGYLATEALSFEAGAGAAPVVELEPGAVLAGRVVDRLDRPVVGAVVMAQGLGGDGRAVVLSAESVARRAARVRGQVAVGGATRFLPRGELGVMLGPIPMPPPPGAAVTRIAAPVPEEMVETLETGRTSAHGRDGGVDDAGAALARADADEPEPDPAAARFVTDEQGRFRITGVPAGRYQLRAAHPDYADARSAVLVVGRGQEREGLRLVMVPGVLIIGRVSTPADEPVVGATVAAEMPALGPQPKLDAALTDNERIEPERLQAVTGLDGRYRLGPVAIDVHLRVNAAGHGGAARAVRLGAAAKLPNELVERTEDFVLVVADARLRGRVRDASGFAVREARVTLAAGPGRGGDLAAGRSALTGEDGRFVIAGLAPGRYPVEVEHADFPPARAEAGTDDELEVELAFGGGLSGQVRDVHTGAGIAGAEIEARGPGQARRELRSGDDGGFELVPIAAGSWAVSVRASGYVPAAPVTVAVEGGRRVRQITAREVRVELARGATVAGVVRDADGRRVRGARVRAGRGVGAVEGRSDAEGSFRLTDVPTGDIAVVAEHDGARGRQVVPLRPGDEVLTLEISMDAATGPSTEQAREDTAE